MSDGSKAFKKFNRTIARSNTLIATYIKLTDTGRRIRSPSDMLRASVVIAVAALDAYITDVFSEKLVPYIKKYTPDELLIDILQDAGLDTKEALNLLKMERPYRRVRALVERYYATYTTQKFIVIDRLFLAYRLKDISERVQDKANRKKLKRAIEILVERRHRIVHDGDYNSHGRLNSISWEYILRKIGDLKLFVTHMDEIICNRI